MLCQFVFSWWFISSIISFDVFQLGQNFLFFFQQSGWHSFAPNQTPRLLLFILLSICHFSWIYIKCNLNLLISVCSKLLGLLIWGIMSFLAETSNSKSVCLNYLVNWTFVIDSSSVEFNFIDIICFHLLDLLPSVLTIIYWSKSNYNIVYEKYFLNLIFVIVLSSV